MIRTYLGKHPQIAPGCFIETSAQVIGDVMIGEHSSIWFNSVVRGDVNRIVIGHHTNIQDLCVIHVARDRYPTLIGNYVTLGHGAIAHGCTIEDHCLIGIGSKVMDGAVIGAESIVAAGALVTARMQVPPRSLVIGIPAVIRRQLNDDDVEFINQHWRNYLELKEIYLKD